MAILEDVIGEDRTWNVVGLISTALAAIAVRHLLEFGWERYRAEEPPQNPAARSVSWPDALAWTVASGLLVGLGRLLAERGAAAGWKAARGSYPRGLN